jgi:hypothetical protein
MKFGLQPLRPNGARHGNICGPVEIRQRTRFETVIAGKDVQCQLKARCRVCHFLKLFGRCVIGVVARKHREIDTVEESLIGILDQLRKDFEAAPAVASAKANQSRLRGGNDDQSRYWTRNNARCRRSQLKGGGGCKRRIPQSL